MASQSFNERTPLLQPPDDTESNITALVGETTPTKQRHHYLDNLRAFLTVLLIFHHVAKCAGSHGTGNSEAAFPNFEWVALSVFTETTAAFLWGSFYFVSGYSSYLSITSTSPPRYADFWRRKFWKRLLFASLWYGLLHIEFVRWLSNGLRYCMRLYSIKETEGPIYYIQFLFALDLFYISLHWLRQHFNWPRTHLQLSPRNIASTLVTSLFLYSLLFTTFDIYPRYEWQDLVSYDTVGSYAPVQFIIAYALGIHFDSVKPFILLRPRIAWLVLSSSLLLSLASLGAAQHLWPELWEFIRLSLRYAPRYPTIGLFPGPYSVFYALWSTFTAITISLPLISLFAHDLAPPWTKQYLGPITRHTCIQTYIHTFIFHDIWIGYYSNPTTHSRIFMAIVFAFLNVGATWICVRIILVVATDLQNVARFLWHGCRRASEGDQDPRE